MAGRNPALEQLFQKLQASPQQVAEQTPSWQQSLLDPQHHAQLQAHPPQEQPQVVRAVTSALLTKHQQSLLPTQEQPQVVRAVKPALLAKHQQILLPPQEQLQVVRAVTPALPAKHLQSVLRPLPQLESTTAVKSLCSVKPQGSSSAPHLVSLLEGPKASKTTDVHPPADSLRKCSYNNGQNSKTSTISKGTAEPDKAPNSNTKMIGHTCCMVQCNSHQGLAGISLMHLPKKSDDPSREVWRKGLLKRIQVDRGDKFNPDTAYICSKHFKRDCLRPHGTGMTLKVNSYPTEHLPKKSVVTPQPPPRKAPKQRLQPAVDDKVCYSSLEEVRMAVSTIPYPWFSIPNRSEDTLLFGILEGWNLVYKVTVTKALTATIEVQGLSAYSVNLETQTLSNTLAEVLSKHVCEGVTAPELKRLATTPITESKYLWTLSHAMTDSGIVSNSVVRSKTCRPVNVSSNRKVCVSCKEVEWELKRKLQRQESAKLRPLKPSVPITKASKTQLCEGVKALRDHEKELQKKVDALQLSNDKHILLSQELHQKLKSSIDMSKVTDPLAKLFWEQQAKAFNTKPTGMRWHPMMIRLAIMIKSQSTGAYEAFRNSGVLKLPGLSTLRDYTNYFSPGEGFNFEVLEQIRREAEKLEDYQRYVVLLHDEMAIQTDLVFDRRTGQVVGFINPNCWNPTGNNLATHVLAFMVVGVNTTLKMTVGYFGTRTATAADLMPLLWEAIGYLETYCNLKVIASTSDKASPNQRLYKLHGQPGEEVCYKAVNLFAPDRHVFFISDVPHLIKTVRNNLSSSGWGRNTRRLWDGKELLWKHVVDVYDRDRELRKTGLTAQHVQLSPYSVMNVELAAQVLSTQVSKVMEQYGGLEAAETAKFIALMDKFFDCLNSRHKKQGQRDNKDHLKPYTSVEDERFTFLETEFLGYLASWKQATIDRPGPFTTGDRNKMFLTYQTYDGLRMTVHGFIEATQYLLRNGVEYVLGKAFNQDELEAHFGRHRGLARRATNPTLWTFGYQDQKLRMQRSLAMMITPKGSVAGVKRKAVVTSSPLKRRR